jgi:hypothetical protein
MVVLKRLAAFRSRDCQLYNLYFVFVCILCQKNWSCSAFVAAADIQAFTQETKAKLLSRCQSKKTKSFVQAVDEICEAFDELNENSVGALVHDPSPPERSNNAVNSHSDNEASGSQNKATQCEERELKNGAFKSENGAFKSENGAVECDIKALQSEGNPINKNPDELHKLEHCSASSKKVVLDDLSSKNAGKSKISGASVVKKKRILDKASKDELREVKKKDIYDDSLDANTDMMDTAVERVDDQKEARKRLRSPTDLYSQLDGKEMNRDETILVKRTKFLPMSDMKVGMFASDGPSLNQIEKRPDQLEEKKEARKETEKPCKQDVSTESVSIKPKVSVTSEEYRVPDAHKELPSGVKNSTKKSPIDHEKISSFKVTLRKSAHDSSTNSPKKSGKGRTDQVAVTRSQEKNEETVGGKKHDKSKLESSLELTKESKKAAAVEAKKSQPSVQGKKPHLSPSKTMGKSSKGLGEKKKVLSKQEELKSTSKPWPQLTYAPEDRSGNNFSAECTVERDLRVEERY